MPLDAPDSDLDGQLALDDHALASDPGRVIRCASCGRDLADVSDVIATPGGGLFINPIGVAYAIVRVTEARNVAAVTRPTLDATWFAGYAWQIAVCSGCHAHVGWHYVGTSGQSPPTFFGFVRRSVAID